LAKLDSTAKGGVVIAIADRLKVPVRFVGLGEEIDDLREFDAREFVDALFESGQGEGDNTSGSYAA
jgi:fused signal recognition particle receptor